MPEVRVIIPTRNRARLLPRAVASVQTQQGVTELEIILVDDGSDVVEHCQLIERLERDISGLRVLRNPVCRGAAAARNLGIQHATSPFIAFLDDDDIWHPTKVRKQLDLISALGDECVMVGCGLERIALGRTPKVFAWPHEENTPWINSAAFIDGFCAFLQSMLVRRSALMKMDLLREDLKVLEDFEWTLRLLQTGHGATLNEVLVQSAEQPDGLFQRYDLRAYALEEIIRAHADTLSQRAHALPFAYYELAKAHARNNHRLPALKALFLSWRYQPTALRPYLALLPVVLGASTVERLQRLRLGRR